jgi:hypothetical protein
MQQGVALQARTHGPLHDHRLLITLHDPVEALLKLV